MHHGHHWLIDKVAQYYTVEEVFFVDGSDTGAPETDDMYTDLCGDIGLCFRRELVCDRLGHANTSGTGEH